MSRRFAAALVCASCFSAPALAGLPTPTDGWHTGALPTPSGEFSYCVTEAKYSNGLWLIVALNPERGINLGMGMPGATMTVGAESEIPVQFEGLPAQQVKARATKPELIVISAGNNPDLLNALAQAGSISIDGNAFALTGSGRAMAELRQCVASRGVPPGQAAAQPAAPAPTAANPVQTTMSRFRSAAPAATAAAEAPTSAPLTEPAPPSLAAVTPPGTRGQAPSPFAPAPISAAPAPVASIPVTEAPVAVAPPPAPTPAPVVVSAPTIKPLPAPLTKLLTSAGLVDITPASEPGSAFAWTSRTLKGRVVEASVALGSNIEQVAGNHLAALTDKCQGTFTPDVGTPEVAGAMTLLTANSTCRGTGVRTYTTYVYALSAQGVLSVISHTLEGGQHALADRAQAGLVKALKGE